MQGATWLLDALVQDLSQALEMMTGQPLRASWSPGGSRSPDASLWYRQSYTKPAGPSLYLGASAHAWSEIGALALRGAGVDLFEQAEARSTYVEIVQQALSALGSAIARQLGPPVEAAQGEVADSAPSDSFNVVLTLAGDGFEAELWLVLPADFLSGLVNAAPPTQPAAPPPPPAAENTAATPDRAVAPSSTMDLLLDIELPVSIRFGRTRASLKDVLKLNSGSVLELDRRPEEPVEILVNNTVIARGEVVVVDGNYGVRISQIATRQQRLALRDRK